jgi:hypothetical protein
VARTLTSGAASPGAAERGQLAAAHAAERAKQHQRPVPRADLVGDRQHLRDGQHRPLRTPLVTGAAQRAWGGGEHPILDGGGQHPPQQPVALRRRHRAPVVDERIVPGADVRPR